MATSIISLCLAIIVIASYLISRKTANRWSTIKTAFDVCVFIFIIILWGASTRNLRAARSSGKDLWSQSCNRAENFGSSIADFAYICGELLLLFSYFPLLLAKLRICLFFNFLLIIILFRCIPLV